MMPADVAGLTLLPPRLVYEAEDPIWGSASLARPHLARALDGATLTVRIRPGAIPPPPVDYRALRGAPPSPAPEPPPEGDRIATFEVKPFVQPAVQPYIESPAVAWRGLLVEQRLLARPELIWTGAFPKDEPLAGPWADALTQALTTLHRRYASLTEERMMDWGLRSLECAECRAERAAKLPPDLPPWQVQMRLASMSRCPHGGIGIRAMGALCRAHPELTFELLNWIEPAGARAAEEGPPATRFALTGPLLEALLGPWLVGEERRSSSRASVRSYETSYRYARSWWRHPSDPKRPLLPREQHNGVALAALAWGVTGEPEVLVGGDASAAEPGLDRAAAPPIETAAALPGERVRRARAKKAGKGK